MNFILIFLLVFFSYSSFSQSGNCLSCPTPPDALRTELFVNEYHDERPTLESLKDHLDFLLNQYIFINVEIGESVEGAVKLRHILEGVLVRKAILVNQGLIVGVRNYKK